ncbi:hypothetical protein PIB30_046395 [Stylosanthes scabra]|uniref:Replication factor A C-terminal domain-containing protein n=1 Tax=Stylosanthes scabra TaxID=79078 RepID=A0ABU6RH37_9FABA|nr:hypothetical protein [Stylosanthes scabra]
MYRMTCLMVVDPKMRLKLRTIPCPWMMLLDPPIFPCNLFRFRTVAEVMDDEVVLPSDFIGEVVGKGDPREVVTSFGTKTKRMVVVLQDSENQRINCNLFGKMVDTMVSRWNGKISLQSNFDLSKVHVNPLLQEVTSFRERLVNDGDTLSGRISQLDSDGAMNGVDEIVKGKASVLTICQIVESTKIAVKIVALNVGSKDWYYEACTGCHKKVEGLVGETYNCATVCKKDTGKPGVQGGGYGTGFSWFDHTALMGEREAKLLCRKASDQVLKELPEADDDYPLSLNKMLERKLLIKIHVRNSNILEGDPVYPVIKIVEDADLVEEYMVNPKPITETSVDQHPVFFPRSQIAPILQLKFRAIWLILFLTVILNIVWMLWTSLEAWRTKP